MGIVLAYILQVCFVMALLYLCYRVLLSSATFHGFKRVVLLSILAISWLLPAPYLFGKAYVIHDTSEVLHSAEGTVPSDGVVEIGGLIPFQEETIAANTDLSQICSVLTDIYLFGVALAFMVTFIAAIQMWIVIHTGKKTDRGSYVLVVSARAAGPFSWGKYIVLRPQDCDSDMELVLVHEMRHLRRKHWIDLLLSQVSLILIWFSPFAYFMMREFKKLHEFEADEAVAPADAQRYQLVLIKKTVGPSFQTFANSLTHSQIKLRITMMMKRKSSSARRLTALAVPAAAALAVLAISQPTVARVFTEMAMSSTTADVSAGKVTKIVPVDQNEAEVAFVSAHSEDASSKEIVADEKGMNEYVVMEEAKSETAASPEQSNEFPAIFVDGKPYSLSLKDINSTDIKSMTILKDDPAYPNGKLMIELKKGGEEADQVYLNTERTAEFKGGQKALLDFITANIKYPAGIDKKTRVIVQFTIDKSGHVGDCKILRGGGETVDAEAKRIVEATDGMWEPAMNAGEPVNSKYVLPVVFSPKK